MTFLEELSKRHFLHDLALACKENWDGIRITRVTGHRFFTSRRCKNLSLWKKNTTESLELFLQNHRRSALMILSSRSIRWRRLIGIPPMSSASNGTWRWRSLKIMWNSLIRSASPEQNFTGWPKDSRQQIPMTVKRWWIRTLIRNKPFALYLVANILGLFARKVISK